MCPRLGESGDEVAGGGSGDRPEEGSFRNSEESQSEIILEIVLVSRRLIRRCSEFSFCRLGTPISFRATWFESSRFSICLSCDNC